MSRRIARALTIAVAALVQFLPSVSWSQPAPVVRWEQVGRATRMAQQGRAGEAVAILRDAVAEMPDDPDLWLLYARALESSGAEREAIAALRRVLTLGTFGEPNVALRIARNFVLAGERDSAFAWLERAIRTRLEARTRIQRDTVLARLSNDPRFSRAAGLPPAGKYTREERWRYDIDFLVGEAQRMHVGPDRPAQSAAFLRAASDLKARAGSLDDERIAVGLVRLLAMLSDGHTAIELRFRAYPYALYHFADGLYLTDGSGPGQALVGSRVLRVGALSAAEALRRVEPYVSRDNAMGLRLHAARLLSYGPILREIGATRTDTIELQLVRGEHDTVVSRLALGPARVLPWRLRPPAAWTDSVPLFLRNERPYWFTSLPGHDAIYLQFNAVRERPEEPLADFAQQLKAAMRRTRARHLIVDLRQNSGGNSFLFPPLLGAITYFTESDTANRIWVMIGRTTFSAAQNFAGVLERYVRGVAFAGEPSGSRPNFVGESPPVILPFSKLQGAISTRYHQNADFTDHRPWIAPSLYVPLNGRDYFARRDPVLEAVLSASQRARAQP